jgi:hypothetical protein
VLHAHGQLAWQTWLLALTGIGMVPLLLALLLQGSGTRRSCAACRSSDAVEPSVELCPPSARLIWREAVRDDARRHRRTLWMVGACVAAWVAVVMAVLSWTLPRLAALLGRA